MSEPLRTTVVIATMNRPDDILRLLGSLERQQVPPREIICVDQSSNEATHEAITDFQKQTSIKINWVKGNFKSLTKARNLGLSYVTTPVVTFLDDDVEVGPDYIKNILAFFIADKGMVLGGIPWLAGLKEKKMETPGKLWSLYRRFFGLAYPTEIWKVAPSFEGTFNPKIQNVTESEWVSGSNFTVLTKVAQEIRWDENLLGYGIGEDLDFPMRVLEKYPRSVFLDPALPVQHHSSPVARLDSEGTQLMKACHFYYLYEKHKHRDGFSRASFLWSRLGLALMPSLQDRYIKVFPDLKELFTSLKIEGIVLAHREEVKKGTFPYKL